MSELENRDMYKTLIPMFYTFLSIENRTGLEGWETYELNVKRADKFDAIYKYLAEKLNTAAADLKITTLDGQHITETDTSDSLELSRPPDIADLIVTLSSLPTGACSPEL